MHLFHPHARRRRALGAVAVLLVGFGGLGAAFFRTQVVDTREYAMQAEANRLRPMVIPAARGTIFDRTGQIIADNVPGYAISLLPAKRDSLRARLERLAPLIGLTPERIELLVNKAQRAPTMPLVVSTDLSFDQVSAVEERRDLFPTSIVDMRPKRRYVQGPAMGQLAGYVAEISDKELELPEFSEYEQGQLVGKQGLEREYERLLAGEPGYRFVKVDARGHIIGDLSPQPDIMPKSGKDLHLYLDLGLQQWAAHVFPDSMRGAIVALEPGTGHVLALYSNPSYDPNLFVGGIRTDVWNALRADPRIPLLQRANAGLYPPPV